MLKNNSFIINFSTLAEDIDKTSSLFVEMEKEQKKSGLEIVGKDLKIQNDLLKAFSYDFKKLVESKAKEQGIDAFGNTFDGISKYQYAEIIVDPNFEYISAIRLLGNVDKEKKNRYTLFGVENTLDPTTLNIISEISDISSSKRKIVWSDFAKTYFHPDAVINQVQRSVTPEDIKSISEEFDIKPYKTEEDLAKEESAINDARFKLSMVKNRDGGYELNAASSFVLEDKESIKNKIAGAIGDPVAVLNMAYGQILDRFSLSSLIQSAAQCIVPPLSCKDILRGLRVEDIEQRVGLVFAHLPKTAEKVKSEISALKEQNKDVVITTDQVLDLIENFIDLEAICDFANLAIKGFDVPTIELPDNIEIVDLFGTVSVEIENAILEALVQSIVQMVIGVLDDLASCNNLDAFVVGAMNGEYGQNVDLSMELQALFDSSNLSSSLGNRWQQFSENIDSVLMNSVNVQTDLGIDVLNQVGQIRDQINIYGGPNGVIDAIAAGDIDKVTGSILLQNMLEGNLDITKVVQFKGKNSDTLNQILREIGQFNISDDGRRFTLNRISDDQVVILARGASLAPNININVSTENLSEQISKLVNDVISILSPGEFLELISGRASGDVRKIVNEVVRSGYPSISKIGDSSNLFASFGKTTGLDRVRDKLILISGNDVIKTRPRKFCVEDDDRIKLREDLLSESGLTPEEVREEIDKIVQTRKDRYNELGDILVKKGDFTPSEILENIKCGTGKQPSGKRPPIIEDQLNSTLDMMFGPVKMTFDREIKKYVDAISLSKKKQKTIPRKVNNNGMPVFQQGQTLLSQFTGGDGVINPEYKQLLDAGVVFDDGATSLEPKLDGPPVNVDTEAKEVAGMFKRGIRFDQNNLELKIDENSFTFSIVDKLLSENNVSDFRLKNQTSEQNNSFSIESPKWLFQYKEKANLVDLKVRTNGFLPSKSGGSVPFYQDFSYIKSVDNILDQATKDRLSSLGISNYGIGSRADAFSILLTKSVAGKLLLANPVQQSFIQNFLKQKYSDYLKDHILGISYDLSNNRLLKKVPNVDIKSLGSFENSSAIDEKSQVLMLNVIDFSPTPTEKQKKCKADPHLLDINFVKEVVKQKFDQECEDPEDANDGLTPTRKPLNSAGYVGLVLTIVRLYVVESVMKSLFVFDQFKYSNSFSKEDLLTDYISFRIREDLRDKGILESFDREVEETYKNLLESGLIVENNESGNFSGSTSEQDRTIEVNSQTRALKQIVKQVLSSVLKKAAEIIGSEQIDDYDYSYLKSLEEVNTFSTTNDNRFGDDIKKSGKFVLEKYARIPKSIYPPLKSQQGDSETGVVNFDDLRKFVSQNPQISDFSLDNLFDEDIKVGVRLTYISPISDTSVSIGHLQNSQNRNRINVGQVYDINPYEIAKEKAFYVSEKVGNIEESQYIELNTFPLITKEIAVNGIETFSEISLLEQFYENSKEDLYSEISQDIDFKVLFDYSLMNKRLPTLMAIYSSLIVNTDSMKTLFDGTKAELKKLFETLEKMGDYTSGGLDTAAIENAAEYQAQFNRIGSPNGPSGPDALYLASITPILLLKGIVEMVDPNIALASKIIAAGQAGYLSPKFKRVSGNVKVEGLKDAQQNDVTLNFTGEMIVTDGKFRVNDDGSVLIKREAVQRSQDGINWELRNDILPGLPIIEYTKVFEYTLDANGVAQPSATPVSGAGKRGLRTINGEIPSDMDLANINPLFDVVDSVPVYPGESVNLPYNLISPSLMPINLYGMAVSPALCGPPVNLGLGALNFLPLEPLLYQLPHFQSVTAKSNLAEGVKKDFGIDLKSKENIGCNDDEN